MEKVLAGLPLTVCLIYLDDILVPGRTFESRITNLRMVLLCLQEAKLKLSPKKCILFQHEVKFLGHIVRSCAVADSKGEERVVAYYSCTFSRSERESTVLPEENYWL